LTWLRILRIGRALRMIKLGRYSGGIKLISNSLQKSSDALQLFGGIFTVLCIAFGSAMYILERGRYNYDTGLYEVTSLITGRTSVSKFQSVPSSMWWCIVTFTTTGYGDMVPVTPLGYFLGIMAQLTGVIMLALPLSILGATFHEERARMASEGGAQDEEGEEGAIEATDKIVDEEEAHMHVLEDSTIALTEIICAVHELLQMSQRGSNSVNSNPRSSLPGEKKPGISEDALLQAIEQASAEGGHRDGGNGQRVGGTAAADGQSAGVSAIRVDTAPAGFCRVRGVYMTQLQQRIDTLHSAIRSLNEDLAD